MKNVNHKLFTILLFLGLFVLTLRPIEDPDFWWHLKTGELISETGTIPKTDPFSFTRAGYPWIAHEWLSEVILYQIYKLGGTNLLILLFSTTITFSFFLVYLRCSGKPYIAGLLILLSALASAPTWGVRPQTFSFLLTAVFIFILDVYQEKRNWQILNSLPLLSLLWVNLHAGYIIGLVIICIYLLVEVIENYKNIREKKSYFFRRVKPLLITLIACLAVSLLNPNGIKLMIYPFTTLFSPSMMQFIQEWYSPDFHRIEWIPLAILLLALIALPAIFRQPIKPVSLLFVLLFTFATLRSMRFSSMLSIVTAPFLADQMYGMISPPVQYLKSSLQKFILNSVILLLSFSAGIIYLSLVFEKQPIIEENNFPKGAADWLVENRPVGNVFNTYSWGGYLIWRLSPEYPVYIDGRADLYGDDYLYSYLQTYSGNEGWDTDFDKYEIKIALLETGAGLSDELLKSTQWKIVYQDHLSILFIRK